MNRELGFLSRVGFPMSFIQERCQELQGGEEERDHLFLMWTWEHLEVCKLLLASGCKRWPTPCEGRLKPWKRLPGRMWMPLRSSCYFAKQIIWIHDTPNFPPHFWLLFLSLLKPLFSSSLNESLSQASIWLFSSLPLSNFIYSTNTNNSQIYI